MVLLLSKPARFNKESFTCSDFRIKADVEVAAEGKVVIHEWLIKGVVKVSINFHRPQTQVVLVSAYQRNDEGV